MVNRLIWILCGCGVSTLLAGMDAAIARAAVPVSASDEAPPDQTNRIEEVVVTAQKRSQKSQDVPVSIAAFSAATPNNAGIQNVSELGTVAPGLQITQNGGVVLPFLRGVGNEASNVGNESSVAIYLDDVYQSRLDPGVLELSSIDHIEVLKGPQGTLFGRNASGGLINVFTRNPTQTTTAELTLGVDNYLTQLAKGYVSGEITNGIFADLSVLHSYQNEGWGLNYATNQKFGYNDYDIIRSKWLVVLDEDTKLRLIAGYTHSKGDFGIDEPLLTGSLGGYYQLYGAPPGPRSNPGFYDSNSLFENRDQDESYNVSARMDHNFGLASFASITAFDQTNEDYYSAGTGVDVVNDINYNLVTRSRTFTQEFQLQSEKGSSFDWIVGLYYLNNFSGYEPTAIFGPVVGITILGNALGPCLDCTVNLYGTQKINDYSGYGQATFHATDSTNITVGVRYTVDDLKGFGATDAVVSGLRTITFPGTVTRTAHFYKPTYKVALDHHFTPDIMGYLSYSRGFKSGTFNTLPLGDHAAAPEVIDAYEAGAKTELFDRSLQLDDAFFYYQVHNPQVQTIQNGLSVIVNAGAAEIKGADIDAEYRVTPDLRLHLGVEYLDAHYTSYPNAPFILPDNSFPYGNFAAVPGDATGNNLINAPRFVYNIGFNYSLPTNIGDFSFIGSYAWNSGFKFDPDNIIAQRSYGLLDASIGYSLPNSDRWHFLLWGKNLTGDRYKTADLEQSGPSGTRYYPGSPLTFGIQASYKFQGEEAEPAAPAPAPTPAPAAEAPAPAAPAPEAQRSFQVFFDFDKSNITDNAARVIQEAADAIKAGKAVQIMVTGHTDTVGSARYNQKLSERRAAAVKRQLVSDGVAASEISTTGVGKTDLLVPTPDGVREPQNRRAEIKLQ